MKSSVRPLAIIMISLFGFLLIATHYTQKSDLKYTGKEMLDFVRSSNYTLLPDSLSKIGNVSFLDIGVKESASVSGQQDTINIPLSSLLDHEHINYFRGDQPKVILSDDEANAHEAWMLLTQLGYENIYVLSK